ncbi:CRISPR-associated RAMP Cmr2 [hydrothermal vent metagenome]|uniref:CRISPR-associated RAMP Cmr2 n=1 Tax=hydrothermal vent metagenome TaxID=652676 RepID=A0A1W1BEH8_9ZZZZ
MSVEKKYIALTLGPIGDTLELGRKTSEIWMASYLFSYFMKRVIGELKERKDVEFLIPYVKDDSLFEERDDGIGMFHDRFILKTSTLSLEDIDAVLQKHKKLLANSIASSIKRDEKKVQNFINDYIQTYLIESEKEYENPVLEIASLLDSIELHTPTIDADEDYIRLFLNRNIVLNSDIAKKSFGKKPSFDSVAAIASQEKDEDLNDVKNAKKYIAIIHADGDNLGEYIKSKREFAQISKRLFEFDKKAIATIKEFGALALFVGGDDLLIFAPVITQDKRTVFDLVDALSKDYNSILPKEKTTLSFGVGITYYKYPLYEALSQSREILFGIAKRYNGKNALAIRAQKHSGQYFEFCIGKDEKGYTAFRKLVNSVLTEEVELPHAIHHKLKKHQKLIEQIPNERIAETFENLFNEDIHNKRFKEGLELLQKTITALGTQSTSQEKLFSMLSTIKLLRGDR